MDSIIEKFQELLDFTNLELERCPWIKELTFPQIMNELKSEVREIEEAKDPEELSSELGDLFRDVLLAIIVAHRDLGSRPLEQVIGLIHEKIKRRKPWVLEGRSVTKEEAERIWDEVKRIEGHSTH